MRYFLDEEFIERGPEYPIELISIGLVAEDGREYYAQSVEYDERHASGWVADNVLAHLALCRTGSPQRLEPPRYRASRVLHSAEVRGRGGAGACGLPGCPWRSREQIKRDLLLFMNAPHHGTPEIWGYYSAYDHVVFAQLFGTMLDLPRGWPMYTRDLKQWADMLGNPPLPEQGKDEHQALCDARWNRRAYEFLRDYEARLGRQQASPPATAIATPPAAFPLDLNLNLDYEGHLEATPELARQRLRFGDWNWKTTDESLLPRGSTEEGPRP